MRIFGSWRRKKVEAPPASKAVRALLMHTPTRPGKVTVQERVTVTPSEGSGELYVDRTVQVLVWGTPVGSLWLDGPLASPDTKIVEFRPDDYGRYANVRVVIEMCREAKVNVSYAPRIVS